MVAWFYGQEHKRLALRAALKAVYDIERLTTRVSLKRAMPRDYVALRQSVAALPAVLAALKSSPLGSYATAEETEGADLPPRMQPLLRHWDNLDDLSELLARALVDAPPLTVTEGGLAVTGRFRVHGFCLFCGMRSVAHGRVRIRNSLNRPAFML